MFHRAQQIGLLTLLSVLVVGCGHLSRHHRIPSPTAAGFDPTDVVDACAQAEGDRVGDTAELNHLAEVVRHKIHGINPPGPKKSILALSGGGCYGAYSAGVLYGWTKQGTRPNFDVVTGISTGSLVAPLAFLGSKYDEEIKRFYTQLDGKDIYQLRIVRGLFSEALATNAPLARQVDSVLTPEVVAEIATEHRKGRRLYVGTTERDSRRFVVWDIGAIACQGKPGSRELIKSILLGSAAIPGFFPASHIPVTINGNEYMEHHIDGGTSATVFIRPPYIPPEMVDPSRNPMEQLTGTDLYIIVAGKLYADPKVVESRAIKIALTSVSTTAYAQTRGDLQRLYFVSTLTGMNYHLASIPGAYPAPETNTDFDPEVMTGMFNEGIRQVRQGTVWRRSPPGVKPGETPLERQGTTLTVQPRHLGMDGTGEPCSPTPTLPPSSPTIPPHMVPELVPQALPQVPPFPTPGE